MYFQRNNYSSVVWQLLKKIPALNRSQTLITVHVRCIMVGQMNSVHALTPYFLKVHFNPLKVNGNYVYHQLCKSAALHCMVVSVNRAYSLNSINKLVFVTVNCSGFYTVRTELLNITGRSSASKSV